ncbi:hypothetical protein ILUMI_02123 [Ignelater luminosus]|uniref:Galectin n=1 Tax=Ignelater luminosus TaxID=2038154 RepID=A0A8K0DIP9_IGNLU|nr:hypothetical protein ILUMI_02123 [Ignelater luminosus]
MTSMLGKPITNPSVPYVGPLGSALSPGKFVRILGSVSSVGKQFCSNLQCGSSHFDDIALHILVRLNEGRIIVKCQQFGTWQDGYIYDNTDIFRGQQFEILVICELTVFKIGVNGQHLCEFPHKVPYERVSHIRVEGDVSVAQISVESRPTTSPPINNLHAMDFAPPPYPGATAPSVNPQIGPPYPITSAQPQPQPMYPGQTVPTVGQYQYNPLLQPPPPQPLPVGAINATPRVYQPPFWSRSYGYRGNRKMAYIGFAVFAAFSIVCLTIFLIVFFKGQREFDEVRKRQEEFHKKYFGD